MFTGLVQDRGRVEAVDTTADGVRLRMCSALASELGEGDSVAVEGVCLTATAVDRAGFAADVMSETLRRSALGDLRAGSSANLELPLRAGDRLGGHVVQGHVDAVGRIRSLEPEGDSRRIWVDAPETVVRYCLEKGSIAVDGVSLTVAALDDEGFEVALIPHTLEVTTLGLLEPGDEVNLEADVLGKVVERLMAPRLS
jgi:riboflavin synthase